MASVQKQRPPFVEPPLPPNHDEWLEKLRRSIEGSASDGTPGTGGCDTPTFAPQATDILRKWFRDLEGSNRNSSSHLRGLARERLLYLPDVLLEAESSGAARAFDRIEGEKDPAGLRRRVEVVRAFQADFPAPSTLTDFIETLGAFRDACAWQFDSIVKGGGVPEAPFPSVGCFVWPFQHLALLPERNDEFLSRVAEGVRNQAVRKSLQEMASTPGDLPASHRRAISDLRMRLADLRDEALKRLLDLATEEDSDRRRRRLVSETTTVVRRFGRKLSFEDYEAIRQLETKYGLRGGIQNLLSILAAAVEWLSQESPLPALEESWKGDTFLTRMSWAGDEPRLDRWSKFVTRAWQREQALGRILDHQAKISFRKTITIQIEVVPARESLIRERVEAMARLLSASIENPRLKKTFVEYLGDPDLVPSRTAGHQFVVEAPDGRPRIRFGEKSATVTDAQLDHLLRVISRPLFDDDELGLKGANGKGLLRDMRGKLLKKPAVAIAELRKKIAGIGVTNSDRGIRRSPLGGYEMTFDSEAIGIDFGSLRLLNLQRWTRTALDQLAEERE